MSCDVIMDDKLLKISAMDCRQYYQLGLVVDQDQSDSLPSHSGSFANADADAEVDADVDGVSECGSEDVDTVPHRYDPPTRLEDPELESKSKPEVVSFSLADEIRMSLANKKVNKL